MQAAKITRLYEKHVLDVASRRLVLVSGQGSKVRDSEGREYLDFGTGIGVNCLGHAPPALTEVLVEQSRKLVHTSNLYYHEGQATYARALNALIGPGKVFFTSSGVEAIETILKAARRWGARSGRFEIITAKNSFHGRTLAGIAATGQEKVRCDFGPVMPGFVHVPFNDLGAVEAAITDRTLAVLIEGVQGEGGVVPATAEYLIGLRRLTRKSGHLLLLDEVQCGGFRAGRFQSYQRILEDIKEDFMPDGVAMAKAIGAGYPLGAAWIADPYSMMMDYGSHGTTYGGSPLACAVGLRVLELIQAERLDENIRTQGEALRAGLTALSGRRHIATVRGLGGMIGVELAGITAAAAVRSLADQGLIVVPAGQHVLRYLPPFNVSAAEIETAVEISRAVLC